MMYNDENIEFLLSYNEAMKKGAEFVGEKAYSLALLNSCGIRVPDGLILAKNAIINDWDLLIEIVRIYLGEDVFIVRSSAVGEDSLQYSWAGCFESVPEVGLSHLRIAVEHCWKSLRGSRAMSYARLHNIFLLDSMAVLIQRYITAEYSGVGFSINPVSGNDREIIIEYQEGKSGGVVGGKGEVFTRLVNKTELSLLEKNDLWWMDVAKKILDIEIIFEKAIDAEWVLKDGVVIIVQARPITTL